MAVSSTLSRVSYIADSILTGFAYPFEVFANTDLQVYVNSVLQTLTTHYTVTGVGVPTGGNVIFLVAPAALAVVLIVRVLPITQASELPANDRFPSTTVEAALDKLTLLIQQLNEVDSRALKVAITSLYSNLTLPDPETGKYLRWRDLTALENAALVASGSISIPVTVAEGGTGLTALGAEGSFLGSAGGAVAYLVDGRVRLANKNGASIAAGEVLVTDPSSDSGAVATTTVGLVRSVLIADETIANNDTGYFSKARICTVNVQGNVTRGDYLRTSATTKRAETAGTSIVDGVFAVALTTYGGGGAGSVTALLLGVTLGSSGAKPAFLFDAMNAAFDVTAFPELVKNLGAQWRDYTLDFDQTSNEIAFYNFAIPTGVVATSAVLDIYYRQAAGTTGDVKWEFHCLGRADGEAWDTAPGSPDTVVSTVPGTVGQVRKVSMTLTNTAAVLVAAAGKNISATFRRNAADAADTLAQDCKFMRAVLRLT